jgi:hypothetical protein
VHTALGAVPAFIHPSPKSAAIIGLGSGDTAWAMAGRPDLETVVTVEIIKPQLLTLQRLNETWPYGGLATLLADPRVEQVFGDGRAFLLRSRRKFDIIEADALRPTSAYAGNLYSDGYFRLIRDRLDVGGIAATWVPTTRVLNTFVRVFPHVIVLPQLLIGSNEPLEIDPARVLARANTPRVLDYYRYGGVNILPIVEERLNVRQTFGPEFDRSTVVDFNNDLFPRDEYDLTPTTK